MAALPPLTGCLLESRAAFRRMRPGSSAFLQGDDDVHVLTWRGSTVNSLLAVLLPSTAIACETFGVGVTVTGASLEDTRDVLASIGECPPIAELAAFVDNLVVEKFDEFVPSERLRQHWVVRRAHLQIEISEVPTTLVR